MYFIIAAEVSFELFLMKKKLIQISVSRSGLWRFKILDLLESVGSDQTYCITALLKIRVSPNSLLQHMLASPSPPCLPKEKSIPRLITFNTSTNNLANSICLSSFSQLISFLRARIMIQTFGSWSKTFFKLGEYSFKL